MLRISCGAQPRYVRMLPFPCGHNRTIGFGSPLRIFADVWYFSARSSVLTVYLAAFDLAAFDHALLDTFLRRPLAPVRNLACRWIPQPAIHA